MTDSHAAAMIKRFREGKPMSRAEREKYNNNGVSEMWWIENNEKNDVGNKRTFTGTDQSDIPRNSPVKPTKRSELWDPIKSPVPVRRNESWRNPVSPPRRIPQNQRRVDDLIADDIEDEYLSRPSRLDLGLESPYSRPKIGHSYDENPIDLLGSLRFSREERRKPTEEKSYRFRTSLRFEDDEDGHYNHDHNHDLDVYRSVEKNRQYGDSVETLGTIGFKSLLAPNLKLDGKVEAPPPKQSGPLELANLTTNLETLMRSFKIERPDEHPLTEYDVPQSIPQVTNQLNNDMLNFMSHYETKYKTEEILEKEQKKRDSEMKNLGKQEAQMKLMMDGEYYSLYPDLGSNQDSKGMSTAPTSHLKREDPVLASLSTDDKILQEIEQNIKQRRIASQDARNRSNERLDGREDGREEKDGPGDEIYRHNLYHRRVLNGNNSHYLDIGLSDYHSNSHLHRMESLYQLHNLDPRTYRPPWQSRQTVAGTEIRTTTNRAVPMLSSEDKYYEEDMPLTGVDVLSFPTVNHRSITTAARDTITCCLNATMTTLALRLPGEEEMTRQKTIEEEVKEKYEQENEQLLRELNLVKKELIKKEQELRSHDDSHARELTPTDLKPTITDKSAPLTTASSATSAPPPPSSSSSSSAPRAPAPSSPSSSPLKIELKNQKKKEEELNKLEELLGPEPKEKESLLFKEVLKKKDVNELDRLKTSQKRMIYFQSPHDLEDKISKRGDDSRQSIQQYIYPSKIPAPEVPKPSAPEIPREHFPLPPSFSSSSPSPSPSPSQFRSNPHSTSRSDSIPRHEREAYLEKMKKMREKMMNS